MPINNVSPQTSIANIWTAIQTFLSNLVSPAVIGGTTTTSTLTLQPTSGVGAAGADIIFKVGNNGATEAMRVLNSGVVGIGGTGSTPLAGDMLRIVQPGASNFYLRMGSTNVAGNDAILQVLNGDMRIRTAADFGGGGGSIVAYFTGAGLVGIGASPLSKLDVNGGVAIGTYAGVNAAPANGVIVSGNVGIGTTNPLTTAHVNGGLAVGVVTKTAAYTATASDYVILADATTAAFTVTLPAATQKGQIITVIKIDSSVNAITVSRAGADTIEGATTKTLSTQNAKTQLLADGVSKWYDLVTGLI